MVAEAAALAVLPDAEVYPRPNLMSDASLLGAMIAAIEPRLVAFGIPSSAIRAEGYWTPADRALAPTAAS